MVRGKLLPLFLIAAFAGRQCHSREPLPNVDICLERVFSGISHPVTATYHENALIVAELKGLVQQLDLERRRASLVLDIRGRVLTSDAPDEQRGLLGFAIQSEKPRKIFVSYCKKSAKKEFDHTLVVSKFSLLRKDNQIQADVSTEETVIEIDQPGKIHNGGLIFFGPDSLLYIATGSGSPASFALGVGAPDDRFKTTSLLGKLLRLDVSVDGSAGRNYDIPETNPFYHERNSTRKEIYAMGFRNPWRCAVDADFLGVSVDVPKRKRFRIICGDLGIEPRNVDEIVIIRNGGVYGWMDSSDAKCEDLNACRLLKDQGGLPVSKILPIFTHRHEEGQALIGGAIYKGKQFPHLRDTYIYGDYVHDTMHYLRENRDCGEWTGANLNIRYEHDKVDSEKIFLVAFVEDPNGEFLVLKYKYGVEDQKGGMVFKMSPSEKCNDASSLTNLFNSKAIAVIAILNTVHYTRHKKL